MDSPRNRGRVLSITVSLFVFTASALGADDQAYFINGGQFGTIDLDTGATVILGTTVNFAQLAAGLGEIGGALYTAGQNGGTLYMVNPKSGALNPVGPSSIIYWHLGSTTTGLYAAGWPAGTNVQSNPPLTFYSIDPRTGAATQIGPFGVPPVAYNQSFSTGSPTLYFANLETLYSIDTNSGKATAIGGSVNFVNSGSSGLTYENGKLYAASTGPNALYTVDPTSAAATMLASFTVSVDGLAPVTPPVSPQILSQFAFGGGWYSALYFTNSSPASVSFSVNFTADTGTPLIVPSIGSSSSIVNLAPHSTAILEALNTGTLNQGYVTASLPAGVTGYGVFRQSVQGVPDQEAVVPLTSSTSTTTTLVWDDTQYTTSVAITNPSTVPVNVSITVWNGSGSIIGTSSVALAAGAKIEAALRSLPGLSGVVGNRGSAQFTVSSGNVAVLGLRFSRTAFTSIPTAQQ